MIKHSGTASEPGTTPVVLKHFGPENPEALLVRRKEVEPFDN